MNDVVEVKTSVSNLSAEQALLGALLYDNSAFERIGDRLKPQHFCEPFHGRLFAAIETLAAQGRGADPEFVGDRLASDPAYEDVGGIRYLADLVDRAPPSTKAPDYARLIYDLAIRRDLMRVGGEIITAASEDHEREAVDQIEAAEQALFAMAEQGGGQTGFQGLGSYMARAIDMASEAYQHDGGISGVPTGLNGLDRMLGGLHATDLIILGARPSMGKSAIAMNIARFAASRDVPCGVFSLEMSGEQLSLRLAAERSGIPGDQIRRGSVSAIEFGRFRDAACELDDLPIHIDATGGLSIAKLVTRARRLKRLQHIGLIIVDYLQLVTVSNQRREMNRVQDVSTITQALKALAKDLGVPVLALSQLSRAVESRDDKRPQLADLRESGSIEQDADVVMFLYREAYYLQRSEPREGTDEHLAWSAKVLEAKGLAELIVAKQRHGPIGTVRLHFDEALTRFSDLANDRRAA